MNDLEINKQDNKDNINKINISDDSDMNDNKDSHINNEIILDSGDSIEYIINNIFYRW